MKLLFATGNNYKFSLMVERLKELKNIELVNPKMLGINIDVVEDGKDAGENSLKKAKAYYEATKLATIAEDSGLYIDKFSDDEQPGLYVKRVNGREDLSDEEILAYYINKLNEHGGKSLAHYSTGVAIINEDGEVFTDIDREKDFLMTSKKCDTGCKSGGILGYISYDLDSNKYFNERTVEDEKEHYKELDEKYRQLVKKYVLKEK